MLTFLKERPAAKVAAAVPRGPQACSGSLLLILSLGDMTAKYTTWA